MNNLIDIFIPIITEAIDSGTLTLSKIRGGGPRIIILIKYNPENIHLKENNKTFKP